MIFRNVCAISLAMLSTVCFAQPYESCTKEESLTSRSMIQFSRKQEPQQPVVQPQAPVVDPLQPQAPVVDLQQSLQMMADAQQPQAPVVDPLQAQQLMLEAQQPQAPVVDPLQAQQLMLEAQQPQPPMVDPQQSQPPAAEAQLSQPPVADPQQQQQLPVEPQQIEEPVVQPVVQAQQLFAAEQAVALPVAQPAETGQPWQITVDQLPKDLLSTGASLFGSEEKVSELLAISHIVSVTYAGVPMQIMMAQNDDAINRYGPGLENGEEYGLESLSQEQESSGSKMINMIDFGANLGVVSIAVFKKFPNLVRAVVVEPAPTTYFYLVANLWLNQVPPLAGGPGTMEAGIAGLQKAVSSAKDFQLTMCIPGHEGTDMMLGSMNARSINSLSECDCFGKDLCSSVASVGVDDLMAHFGNEDINFVKMDCESCEAHALPALETYSSRVKRFAGEMHMMPPNIVDLACKYNNGQYLTGMCQAAGTQRVEGTQLCEKCSSGFVAKETAVTKAAGTENSETEGVMGTQGPVTNLFSQQAMNDASEEQEEIAVKLDNSDKEEEDEHMELKAEEKSSAQSHAASPKDTDSSTLTYDHLPESLRDLGVKLFGSQAKLEKLLSKSQVIPVSFAGLDLKLAMAKNDDAATRFGPGADNGEEYGLDTVAKTDEIKGMLNLIDLGANLGVVTIALSKKHPSKVRAVSVEPVPTTYFYFVVNLWLNDVPQLRAGEAFTKAGVVAVQKAISRKPDFTMDMCIPGHDHMSGSMNAFFVTVEKGCNCEYGGPDLCSTVTSMNLASIFDIFGEEQIHFLKMDCEGCEEEALPALEEKNYKARVGRLAGEMHMMPPKIYDLVCQYNEGTYLTGMCKKQWPNRLYGKELCGGCASK